MRSIRAGEAVAVALLALALLALGGCDAGRGGPRYRGAGRAEPYRGGTLTLATSAALATLDPAQASDAISSLVLSHLHDTLVDYEPARADDPAAGTRLVPRLAERWTISPDGLIYDFTLRAGARYADGRPIVAADVAYALTRTLGGTPSASYLRGLDGAAAFTAGERADVPGIEVTGERTLRLRLVAADPTFLFVLARRFAAPLRADFVAAHGGELRAAALASGPFMLERWDEGQRLVLVRNPAYWDPARPYLDRIVLLENLPEDSAFLRFEAGDLDVLDRVSLPDWLWISAHPGWRPYVHARPQIAVNGSRMNVTVAPFDDVRVRQALNYALDKAHLVKLVGGLGVPAHGMVPPGLAGRAALTPYPHDPARARALLAEAGYPRGFAVEYVTLDDAENQRLAQSVQADLAAVGVRMTIRPLSWPTYLETTTRPDGAPFSMAGWSMDLPDPSSMIEARFHSSKISPRDSYNDSFYASAELDRVLDDARRALDPAARAALYQRADRIVHDDAPWLWGVHPVTPSATQPYVRGFAIHPVWGRDLREVWLDLDDAGRRVRR